MQRWIDGLTDRLIGGLIDGQTDEWTDRWRPGWTSVISIFLQIFLLQMWGIKIMHNEWNFYQKETLFNIFYDICHEIITCEKQKS